MITASFTSEKDLEWVLRVFLLDARPSDVALDVANSIVLGSSMDEKVKDETLITLINTYRNRGSGKPGPLPGDKHADYLAKVRDRYSHGHC